MKKRQSTNHKKNNEHPILNKIITILLLLIILGIILAITVKLFSNVSGDIKILFGIAITCIDITIIYNIIYNIVKHIKEKKSIKDTIDNAKSITDYIESKTNSPSNRYKSTQTKYSTSKKCKRQNQLSKHTKNRKNNNLKAKSYRFPLELDVDGYFCTYIDEDEFLYRVDLGITKEIEDISQYQVRIRIRIEDNYIQSANLFYNDEVSEQIKVLNPDALQ